jgi:hypothetical protein
VRRCTGWRTPSLLRPLIDRELSIVFYDLTTIRTEGSSESMGELRQYGLAKEGDIARQVMLDIMYGPAAPQGTRIKLEVGYTAAQSRIEGAGHEQV